MRGGTRRIAGVLVVGGVVLALALAGCSAARDNSSDSTAAKAPAQAGGAPNEGFAGGNAGGTTDQSKPDAANPGQVLDPAEVPGNGQRSIVYTGDITVRVSDVDGAAGRLAGIAGAAGGYVSADQRSIDAGQSSAAVTLRIPAGKFDGTLGQITGLGKELSRQITSQDVTAQVVDLDSRVKTQQASVDRIRALLAQATTIAEITSVESELTRREADLESLQAQLAALSDQAALSTITVHLLGPEAAVVVAKKKHGGFVGGLLSGWHALGASVGVLLTVLGALLPFAVVIGVPALLVVGYARRRARRTAQMAPPAPQGRESGQ